MNFLTSFAFYREMEFREGMEKFVDWLRSQDVYWEKLGLQLVGQSEGFGLFARENIRLGETLIKIPERYLITEGFVKGISEYRNTLKRASSFDEPAEVLALFFAFERVYLDFLCGNTPQGDVPSGNGAAVAFLVERTMDVPPGFAQFNSLRRKSARSESDYWWRHYLGVLPRQFGTPLFHHYCEKDGAEKLLKIADKLPRQYGEKLLSQLAELRSLEKKLFDILFCRKFEDDAKEKTAVVDAEHILAGPIADLSIATQSQEQGNAVHFWREICCWAWHIVNTRCIFVDNLPPGDPDASQCHRAADKYSEKGRNDYGGSLACVPLVDMLNHSPDAQCIATFDHKHSRNYLVRAEHHSVGAGEQLFVCYGPHDNAKLWIEYGFRLPAWNPFNRVNISIDLFIALAERSRLRVSELRREVLRKADLPCTIYATDDLPSFALRKNCSILLLPREQLANWSQHIFDDASVGEDEEPCHERKLLNSILEKLQRALETKRSECHGEEAPESIWLDQLEILERVRANLEAGRWAQFGQD